MAPQVRPAETDSFEAEGGSYYDKTTWYLFYLKYNYSIAGFEPRLNEKNYFISRRKRQRIFVNRKYFTFILTNNTLKEDIKYNF